MSVTKVEIRPGAYCDSVVLMQLQQALAKLPDVIDAGVVMGTEANKDLLKQTDLFPPEANSAGNDDMLIVIAAKNEGSATFALSQIDELLSRRSSGASEDFCPRSVESAVKAMPHAKWVLISVPGRYAAEVAHQALDYGKNVFLYSDNVSVEHEIELKQRAAKLGLMVMGPDCGTAIVNGVGLGFANKVRLGCIGLVGASGTGLQAVSCGIHRIGQGITHALGTGGRDLSEKIGAISAYQGLNLLARDPETRVIALISKPPAAKVAEKLIGALKATGKPAVVNFIGYTPKERPSGDIHFASTLDETAQIAAKLAQKTGEIVRMPDFADGQRYLRGLFSGGTLAYEALLCLKDSITLYSNMSFEKVQPLKNIQVSEGHTIVDLGEDEFTVGRLHPMMDNDLRIRRLRREADDPEVAVILLDVVLGYGAHGDPAGELAPAIAQVKKKAKQAGRNLEVVTLVVGTDEDPQDFSEQVKKLEQAGAKIELTGESAYRYVGYVVYALSCDIPAVDLAMIKSAASINVGLDFFKESLKAQETPVIHVEWKPPAGGNDKLAAILERMKKR